MHQNFQIDHETRILFFVQLCKVGKKFSKKSNKKIVLCIDMEEKKFCYLVCRAKYFDLFIQVQKKSISLLLCPR
ncbi:hypothetical protein BpHYR1_001894 [Brachionus plicatilis]|uniref:Uncharacterized protein n=1 Tax=Brachionus plicatilis TaxID=10195 RepID=A0A3M7SJB8_BRAPC|nr:hypothetical protein BpHYR1_001894 [Brachionus plicatilis]